VQTEREGELHVGGMDDGGVGFLFQDPDSQLVMARAGDDVAFGLEERCVPTEEIWPRVDAALAAIGFPYGRDHPTSALSGGERQRLALAGVLALRPRLLVLDEPTANLDQDGARALYAVLARLDRSTTLVLIEHHLELALGLADRVVAVDGERGVVVDGPIKTVLAEQRDELERLGTWLPDASQPRPIAPEEEGPGPRLIAARALGFRYPGSARDALATLDLDLAAVETLSITGPNGSGKSTLLLILAGLLRPQRGSVRADALDARAPEPWRWPADRLARRFGTVFQDPDHQFLTRSVREELRLGPRLQGASDSEAARRADELLHRLGLADLGEASPFTLSGGEKRRLSVGTALACQPRVLFLDEPTYGQDRTTFLGLIELLRDARAAGAAVCAATHERALVAAMGGRELALIRA